MVRAGTLSSSVARTQVQSLLTARTISRKQAHDALLQLP